MKAACIERTGPPEVIELRDLPEPSPGPGQVLVRVAASAVNPIDTYVRAGSVAMPLEFPFVVGCDLAGEVVAVGEGVGSPRPGMRVWGSNQGLLGRQGTAAEYTLVDPRWLYPTPEAVTDAEAAAAALVGITAHLGLIEHGRLAAGETLFISGTAAIDASGATVHAGDAAAQIEATLANVRAILDAAGCRDEDVLQAIAYCKTPDVEGVLNDRWADLPWPRVVAIADVCRDDLLFEIEATAAVRH